MRIAVLAVLCLCSIAAAQDSNPGATRPLTAGELRELLKGSPDDRPVSLEEAFSAQRAAGKGASGKTDGDKATQQIDGTAPTANLGPNGPDASGGATKVRQSAEEVTGAAWYRIVLGLIGLALIGGGVYKVAVKEYDTAITQILTGALCGLCAIFPSLLYLLAIGIVVGSISHYLPDKVKSAYHALVDGVGTAPATVQNLVAPFIKQQATAADVQHIQQTAAANDNPVKLA